MPSQTHLPESLPIPKPSVRPLKTSAPLEVPRLRNLEKWLDPRNLRAVPRLVKCQSSPHPPNQLSVQLPGVAVCPDHQVTLRTLLLPSDTVYHFFKFLELETWLLNHLVFFVYLIVFARVKVVLWSKFCIPFSLLFWEAEVLNTYHAKFYLKIRTVCQFILTLFFGFGRPPLLDPKMTGCIKNELAPVNQIGSDVIFASHQNFSVPFWEKWDVFKDLFGVYNL